MDEQQIKELQAAALENYRQFVATHQEHIVTASEYLHAVMQAEVALQLQRLNAQLEKRMQDDATGTMPNSYH